MTQPAPHYRLALVVAVLAGGLVGGTLTANATIASDTGAGDEGSIVMADDGPAEVSIVSPVLDAFTAGSTVGPYVVSGIVSAVMFAPELPPAADEPRRNIVGLLTDLSTQLGGGGTTGMGALREAVAPLECANPALNQILESVAGVLDTSAVDHAETIEPFELTAAEIAQLARDLEVEHEPSC